MLNAFNTMNAFRRKWVVALLALSILLLAKSEGAVPNGVIQIAEEATEVVVEPDRPLLIWLESVDGDVEVIGEDRDSVSLTISDFDVGDEDRNRAEIFYDREAGSFRLKLIGDLLESDLKVRAPWGASLRLKTVDGDLAVTGVRGEIEASTADGDLELSEISGGLAANSVDGDISVTLREPQPSGPISVATIDGKIRFAYREGLNADVSVTIVDGDFACDVPLRATNGGQSGFQTSGDGVRIEAMIGTGGPLVSLKTIDGDIEIEKR